MYDDNMLQYIVFNIYLYLSDVRAPPNKLPNCISQTTDQNLSEIDVLNIQLNKMMKTDKKMKNDMINLLSAQANLIARIHEAEDNENWTSGNTVDLFTACKVFAEIMA